MYKQFSQHNHIIANIGPKYSIFIILLTELSEAEEVNKISFIYTKSIFLHLSSDSCNFSPSLSTKGKPTGQEKVNIIYYY